MKVAPITAPLPGEHLATTEPTMAPETAIDSRQRLNFWAGRALTADALELEQEHRAAKLARSGRLGTAGVVTGLDVALEPPAEAQETLGLAGHFLHLLPGYGITVSGEDVVIPRALRVPLEAISLIANDKDEAAEIPWAAVLLARPAELGIFENIDATDPCELDPSHDAFADERRLDAMVLRLFQLPLAWQDDPLLGDTGDARWRNRLAQLIFRAESLPWEAKGLPLALLATETLPGETPSFFLDRASVVRLGGRSRAPFRPFGIGTPALWRARVDQFAEQLSRFSDLPATEQAAHFQFLPPVGLLPRNALEFLTTAEANLLSSTAPDRAAVSHFFPESIAVEAVPMPLEDLDAELAASAPLAPFDFAAGDDVVRMLVPVPQQVFDPRLLVVEQEDPFFAREVARLVSVRQDWRQRRDFQQLWVDGLTGFISGPRPPAAPLALEQGQFEPEPVEDDASLPAAAYLSPNDTPGPWEISAPLVGEALTPATLLFVALRLDADQPPSRVEMRWQRKGEEFTHVWTEPSVPFAEQTDAAGNALAIPLTRFYAVTAGELGATGDAFTSFTLHLEDGRVALTEVGALLPERSSWWMPPVLVGAPTISRARVVFLAAQNVTFVGGDWKKIAGDQLEAPFEERSEPDLGGDLFEPRVIEVESALNPEVATPRPDPISVETDGLEKALATLAAEANEADDFIDTNFLRAQTNLYRIRKLILGETAAQKLLISPAISVIAEQQTAAASAATLNNYLAAAKLVKVQTSTVTEAIGIIPRAAAPPATTGGFRVAESTINQGNPFAAEVMLKTPSPVVVSMGKTVNLGGAAETVGKFERVTTTSFPKVILDDSIGTASVDSSFGNIAGGKEFVIRKETFGISPIKIVFGQLPESGPLLPPRGLSIGQRFEEPPATTNLAFARSALVALVDQLPRLRLPLINQTVRSIRGTDVSLLELQGRSLPADTSASKRTAAVNALLDAAGVITNDAQTDEAEITLGALDLIEIKSAILRTIEAVVQQRRVTIDRGRLTIAAIAASAATTQARLSVLAAELAEARHDVNVARALRQEEDARIDAINDRRDAVLRDAVKFLAYVRPRAVDPVRRVVAGWKLESGDALAAVPACLRLHGDPPDGLHAYVQLFRQAPVRWFPAIAPRLRELDTPNKLFELLASTKQAATVFSAQQRVAFAQQVTHVETQNTLLSAFSIVEPSRLRAANLQFQVASTVSWTDLHQQAQDHSSLGDIIDGRHGNPALARSAAALLEQIEDVATCLHAEFAAVSAATRLLWVERYSQFDRASPLRDLTILPGYGSLDRAARRRFQAFVDWLFQRVESSATDAFGLVNDLIRICLLLASHAPVKTLIGGHLPRPLPVRPGVLIPVRPFDPKLVKVGMEVHIWKANTLVAHALVEDLSQNEISARVDQVPTALATLDETMRVQFVPRALGIARALTLR